MKKALILILSLIFIVGNTFAKYNKGEVYIPKPKKMVGNAGSNQDPTKADIYKKLDTLDTLDGKGKIKTLAKNYTRVLLIQNPIRKIFK